MLVRKFLTQKGVIMIHLIVSIIVGAFVGWVAGQIMGTEKKGFIVNAVLGLLGGFVGGLIGNLLHIGSGWLVGMILSIVGACLVIFVFNKLRK